MSNLQKHHPSTDEWVAWIEHEGRAGDRLDQHRQSCEPCASLVSILAGFRESGPGLPFGSPPDELRERARALAGSREQASPERPAVAPRELATVEDVRGSLGDLDELDGLPSGGSEKLFGGEFPGARVHLAAREIPARGELVLAGKLWLDEAGAGPIELLLLQEDHVLCREELEDGEFFVVRELAEPGWAVEFHLPAGECIRFHGAGPTP